MPSQSELVGNHPSAPNQFTIWLSCNDVDVTVEKCHRSLKGIIPTDNSTLIEWFARLLIKHHYSDFALNRLRAKFNELGFPKYADQQRRLPRADKTQKGNGAEILLAEYIQSSLNIELIGVKRLRYNSNVDQSMKGDDNLIASITNENGQERVRLYLGEAKFRTTPTKTVIDEIIKSLAKEKKPISYSYLIEELAKNPETLVLANKLDDFLIDEIKGNDDLIYTGLLISNEDTFTKVEDNLRSDNPSFIFISVAIDSPGSLIEKGFEKAEELILDGQI
jgi:hypothetical protein